jgi:hypothetical protein
LWIYFCDATPAVAWTQNKLFYTWLRVAELRNIQAAKRIVAQRRRQKLKLARLLRPQLPLLASWEPLAKAHDDATADLGHVLSAACTDVPLAAGAQVLAITCSQHTGTCGFTLTRYLQADLQSLHETMSYCVRTVDEIESISDTFYATVRAPVKDSANRLDSIAHGCAPPRAGRRDERRDRRARADDPAGDGVPP